MRAIWGLLVLAAACVDATSQRCADGRVCPTGLRCAVVAAQPYCVKPDQLGCTDGQACGDGSTCHENVCLANECGNNLVDSDEVCDKGDTDDGNGCSATCTSTEVCGNSIVDPVTGEQCDTGVPGLSSDGCSSTCLVEGLAWNNVTPSHIVARRDTAIAWDIGHSELVLFGGVSETAVHDDTWVLKAGGWKRRIPGHSPPARYAHAMAYDIDRGKIVLFGGTASTYLSDTWELDGYTWTERTPAVSPPPRAYAALAYHAGRKVTVLFGGRRRDDLSDTWIWNGTTWALQPGSGPPAVDRPLLVYDPTHGEIVFYGGGETWVWNNTWTKKTVTPPTQANGDSMALDSQGRVLLVTGSPFETWVWNGTSWSKLATATTPPDRTGSALAIFPAATTVLSRTVLFGGIDPFSSPEVAYGETWAWDATAGNWTTLPEDPVSPPAREGHAFVYDELRGYTLTFGGSDGSGLVLGDTWLWADSGWLRASSPVLLTPRAYPAAAYDEARGRVVMFGGGAALTPFGVGNDFDETWTWGATGWSNPAPAIRPPGRRFGAMTFDRKNQEVVLFGGGQRPGASLATLLNDTWVWNGTTWAQRSPSSAPSPRLGAGIAYDPIRERAVLFGGLNLVTALDDTWEWDGTTWTKMTLPVSPEQRGFMSMAYDPGRQAIVLAGGRTAADSYDDVWEYDGTAWTKLTPQGGAGPRLSLAYDAINQRMVSFGGRTYFGISGETWSLEYRSPVAPREVCILGDADDDGDGAKGCADADCWSRCTPLCPPGASCPTNAPRCGDGMCNALETHVLCPADC